LCFSFFRKSASTIPEMTSRGWESVKSAVDLLAYIH
jgi:hypothetical protein